MNENIGRQLLFVCYKQYVKTQPDGDPKTFLDWARDEVTDASFSDLEKEKILPIVEAQVIRGICEHWKTSLPGEPLAAVSDSIISHLDLLDSKCEQIKELEAQLAKIRRPLGVFKTFEEAWAQKQLQGYQYGDEALQNVHMGWEMAQSNTDEIYARIVELEPLDDEENPSAHYVPAMKAAIVALERAHKKVEEITGYSGGSGNWPAQEDEVRMRFALEHLKKGDCTKNDDDIKIYLRAQLDEALARVKQYSASSTNWYESAEKLEAQLLGLADDANALVESLPKCTEKAWNDEEQKEFPCPNVATRAYKRGGSRYCDDCADRELTQASAMVDDWKPVPEYPRAVPVRKLTEKLSALAQEKFFFREFEARHPS